MITRIPLGRNDLRIKRHDRVLEIGCGHNPTFRSNVITDKYEFDNSQRCGDIRIFPHQKFIAASGEKLPFDDHAFDYVICNQVLEHAEDPSLFIEEIMRVGRRGYIETPTMLGELLFPKEAHKWVVLIIDGKLILYEKTRMPGNYRNNYGELFLNYLPYQSLPYKTLYVSEPNLLINRIEWRDRIECLVNPEDPAYSRFFLEKWDREMVTKVFPPRKAVAEIAHTMHATLYLLTEKLKSKLHKPAIAIPLEEYLRRNKAGK